MISSVNNSPSFTSVIPLKVYVDGMQTFDEKLIKTACRQLGTTLTGTPKTTNDREIKAIFAAHDRHYSVASFIGKRVKPSDFLRCVMGKSKDAYLFTGPQANVLSKCGKNIGVERRCCKEQGVQNSFDLYVAKINYSRQIAQLIDSTGLRIKDGLGKLLTLNINMNSNKKYGLSTFKVQLDKIFFTS